MGVLPARINELLGQDYEITNPITGEATMEPGWKLMAMIKAATDVVYAPSLAATVQATPPGLPPEFEQI